MEPKASLLYLQVPSNCSYHELEQSSPYPRSTSWRFII